MIVEVNRRADVRYRGTAIYTIEIRGRLGSVLVRDDTPSEQAAIDKARSLLEVLGVPGCARRTACAPHAIHG